MRNPAASRLSVHAPSIRKTGDKLSFLFRIRRNPDAVICGAIYLNHPLYLTRGTLLITGMFWMVTFCDSTQGFQFVWKIPISLSRIYSLLNFTYWHHNLFWNYIFILCKEWIGFYYNKYLFNEPDLRNNIVNNTDQYK